MLNGNDGLSRRPLSQEVDVTARVVDGIESCGTRPAVTPCWSAGSNHPKKTKYGTEGVTFFSRLVVRCARTGNLSLGTGG